MIVSIAFGDTQLGSTMPNSCWLGRCGPWGSRIKENIMLRELGTFIAVCRYGTFTSASARLNMTQSAVSDHIRRLEEYLDTQLFQRTGRSAKLNSVGQEFLPLAEQALELLEKMRKPSANKPLRGTIRIGTIASMHSTLVARAMVLFRQSCPDVTIRAVRIESGAAGHVEREELDLAVTIRPGRLPSHPLSWIPLFRTPYVLIAPSSWEQNTWRSALRRGPLIRYEHSTAGGRSIDEFLAHERMTVKEAIWMNHFDAMATLVSYGVGAAFVPLTRLIVDTRNIKVISLEEKTFYRELGILTKVASEKPDIATSRFIDALKEVGADVEFSETVA